MAVACANGPASQQYRRFANDTAAVRCGDGRTVGAEDLTFHARFAPQRARACIVAPTVAFALSRGMTIDAVEATTGASREALADPEARLDDDVTPRLWRALSQAYPDEALTIAMARAAPLSLLGGLAHGAQFAATLEDALRFLAENSVYVADRIQVALMREGDETAMSAWHPHDALDDGRTTEVGAGVVSRVVAEVLEAGAALKRVEFSHGAHGDPGDYEVLFRAPVAFSCARTALVFNTDALTTPIPHHNLELFSFISRHYSRALEQMRRAHFPPDLQALGAAIVENAEQGVFSAQAAAAGANVSLRSAQRLALKHGVTLHGMIDQVRAATAIDLVAHLDIGASEAAGLLGYADDRAFRRAFKRWTGETLSAFRRKPKTRSSTR